MKKIASLIIILMISMGLTSCAITTMIKKSDLDTQTKMSSTLFLEPVSQDKRVVFISIRNTSDKKLNIVTRIKNTLIARGYVLTQNPDDAHFMLQANVLKVGKSDARASDDALSGGFGGALLGSALSGNSPTAAKNATIVGGIVGFAVDAMVSDIYYTMVTDLQIRERPLAGEIVSQRQKTSVDQGSGTQLIQNISGGQAKWKTYRTRIVSTANQVNLKFDEAIKSLEDGLVRSISGIF
ncbi:conjugal transfer protein TraT [Bathymodiolus thermophilus thioautotrophic gill symbiont]|uniref:Conjugal transfer protein TraT n=1 Tax=Bathymodiolus thermophilus thioautotrophic gill symbiont TaxID=2360 RepID=A0A3G3IJS8_9GAMM|nr:complement resistance protein TraT [Bathymodiolus thermophilus thioautotrophic gill symbiont]AYQ56095.1 conjugal transfer protein TraT [Bathymodiolus thermophilus thioautotrophic gill symbiont]